MYFWTLSRDTSVLDPLPLRCAQLSASLDHAVERMNRDAEERPYLVDKRLVTQLMLQFMTARDENPEVRSNSKTRCTHVKRPKQLPSVRNSLKRHVSP